MEAKSSRETDVRVDREKRNTLAGREVTASCRSRLLLGEGDEERRPSDASPSFRLSVGPNSVSNWLFFFGRTVGAFFVGDFDGLTVREGDPLIPGEIETFVSGA